jgi:hypothetical protein
VQAPQGHDVCEQPAEDACTQDAAPVTSQQHPEPRSQWSYRPPTGPAQGRVRGTSGKEELLQDSPSGKLCRHCAPQEAASGRRERRATTDSAQTPAGDGQPQEAASVKDLQETVQRHRRRHAERSIAVDSAKPQWERCSHKRR